MPYSYGTRSYTERDMETAIELFWRLQAVVSESATGTPKQDQAFINSMRVLGYIRHMKSQNDDLSVGSVQEHLSYDDDDPIIAHYAKEASDAETRSSRR